MELNQERIENGIIEEVSSNLINEDDLRSKVYKAVDDRINNHFLKIADEQITQVISAAIKNGFEREYQRVDSFGRKQGESTTIAKQLEHIVSGYWADRVDKQGKKTSDTYNTISRAEYIMQTICADGFSNEMKQHVANLGGALKDSLRAELHETVNRLLSEVFNVKSMADQNAVRR